MSALSLTSAPFGTHQGRPVTKFVLSNGNGIQATVMDFGATLISLLVPDRDGKPEEVTLGFDSAESYDSKLNPYFGASVGRYANRIAKGKFTLEGKEYTLACNNGPNHLHGGNIGFNRVFWTAATFKHEKSVGVTFTYLSKDGEEGYPGNLKATSSFTLFDDNTLAFDHTAETDQTTIVNLTNHTYWNLEGPSTGPILEHELTLHCDKYLPVDRTLIPTGETAEVKGTPMDFTIPHLIGARAHLVGDDAVKGYDHCYVINQGKPLTSDNTTAEGHIPLRNLNIAAKVVAPKKGRTMEVFTDQAGIQFYSGNFLDGVKGANGLTFNQYQAFCLETQKYPDSINQKGFTDVILRPGQTYQHHTLHKFSWK